MAQWFTKMPPEYREQDMPLEASFVCSQKTPHLRARLVSVSESLNPVNGVREGVIGTGVEVRFSKGQYRTRNSKLFKLLLESKQFRNPRNGFDIDAHDPSGLWRALGFVEEVPVVTHKIVQRLDIKPEDLSPKKILERMKTVTEPPKPLVDVK